MRILEAVAMLCGELQKSPALRIVFSFKDGTWMLVGKSSGAELDISPVCAYPGKGTPEVVEVEGIPCDQVGTPLPDAKKVQRFVLAELIAGFDLLEADPKTLARVREALSGQRDSSAVARPAPHQSEPAKGEAHAQRHLRMAEDGPAAGAETR
jgi:hypothetical protein